MNPCKFVFLAPLKEPFTYTKGDEEKKENEQNKETKENKQDEQPKENAENKENNEDKNIKENEQNKENEKNNENKENKENENNNENKEDNKGSKLNQRIPIFIEPYFFMGIYTLPYIESEWPESITRKNVKFDLIEILKKSTN